MLWKMGYNPPDGWTLPDAIEWHECQECGMIYGDGDMDQGMFTTFYRERYGFGLNSPHNVKRLTDDANMLAHEFPIGTRFVDFGGAGEDGESVLVRTLKDQSHEAVCVNAGEEIPPCDVIYASHVIEHIYNLPAVMAAITERMLEVNNGTLIIDVPDSTGLLEYWRMPILDYNTKHLNHFTLRTLLHLGWVWGFESVNVRQYELENAPAFQVWFKLKDTGFESMVHVTERIQEKIQKLLKISQPVNVWGLGDITWHILSQIDLAVIDYIDSDPAMRGQTFKGKPILDKPTNYMPIVIMAQGQRGRLVEYIRKAGYKNQIIEI